MAQAIVSRRRHRLWAVLLGAFVLWFALIWWFIAIPAASTGNAATLSAYDGLDPADTMDPKGELVSNSSDPRASNLDGDRGATIDIRAGEATFNGSAADGDVNELVRSLPSSKVIKEKPIRQHRNAAESRSMSCTGRYIYVHHLPRQFNGDLLRHCKSLSTWTDMCELLANYGLGPRLRNTDRVFGKTGWYATNQFSLEVIFHNRMKQYECLTDDPSVASAVFVPYYAGLDVARYLWDIGGGMRDAGPLDLARWLRRRPEWKAVRGKDHFLVAGRIAWDLRRETDLGSDWGSNLLLLPELNHSTVLVLESSLVHMHNDFAIPYPTYFHPSRDIEVIQWQNRMRRQRRRFLFSFAGAPRPNLGNSIRDEIIRQCRASRTNCILLECTPRGKGKCYQPINLMKMFQSSVFCLQPPGDSYTRRSTFDSILAGCIPVFFHSASAYEQYKWHLPDDNSTYSVFIPENNVKDGHVDIERLLHRIAKSDVLAMQEEVIRLIPRLVYADPRSRLETFEDAFDITIKGVLQRIQRIKEGGLG